MTRLELTKKKRAAFVYVRPENRQIHKQLEAVWNELHQEQRHMLETWMDSLRDVYVKKKPSLFLVPTAARVLAGSGDPPSDRSRRPGRRPCEGARLSRSLYECGGSADINRAAVHQRLDRPHGKIAHTATDRAREGGPQQ